MLFRKAAHRRTLSDIVGRLFTGIQECIDMHWRIYSTAHGIIVNIVLEGYALHGCGPSCHTQYA